jgi:high-affinity iron transporter
MRQIKRAVVLIWAGFMAWIPWYETALAQERTDLSQVIQLIESQAEQLIADYEPAGGLQTGAGFSRLYFDVFESSGMELEVGLLSQSLMKQTEAHFGLLINLCMQGREMVQVTAAWKTLRSDLQRALQLKRSRAGSWMGQFVQSFVILFREGLEAMLVLTALVLYLRRSGNGDKVTSVWLGAGLAVLASVGVAWLLNRLVSVSGSYQERVEGAVMLAAALLMLSVAGWLYRRRNMDWRGALVNQADRALSRGGLFALSSTAFLAVFREGAETLLFYQALLADAESMLLPLWGGVGLAVLVLVLIYWLMDSFSLRIPLKAFFSATALLLLAMSLNFIGKGILELQMGGILPQTAWRHGPNLPWIGVFPIRETLLAQLMVLGLAVMPLLMRGNEKQSCNGG